jgi:integrase
MKALDKFELKSLLEVAGKHSWKDELLFRMLFNHAMRITEAVGGWLEQKDGTKVWHEGLTAKNVVGGNYLVAPRLKGSRPVEHPILPDEKERPQAYDGTPRISWRNVGAGGAVLHGTRQRQQHTDL